MTDDLVEKVAQEISRHDKYRVPSDSEKPASYEYFMPFARAALSAIEDAGWCVVPVEPTWEMAKTGKGMMPVEYDLRMMTASKLPEFPAAERLVAVGFEHPTKQAKPDAVYTAMIAARPRITGEATDEILASQKRLQDEIIDRSRLAQADMISKIRRETT